MTERVDCVVIGAGVIGLAIARRLALAGRDVIVLEAADAIGTETSSRNSEVIHAGIYYPKGSLKARACLAGNVRLYDYCRTHGVSHNRTEKLIVASNEGQLDTLADIRARGEANGVDDLESIDAATIRKLEPALSAVGALRSPSTGIIDSHGLMLAYQGDAEERGAMIAFNAPVRGGRIADDGIHLTAGDGAGGTLEISAEMVVNSAGLGAQAVAHAIDGMPHELIPPLVLAKGNYFSLSGASPFSHLIYPVPEPGGLGVHVTLDLGGQARFGPDVEWVDSIDYEVDPARAERFYPAIRAYYPDLKDGSLLPGYAGIRPKVAGKNQPPGDFIIQGPADHGIPGLVSLYGIESPGLTASLPLADHVAAELGLPDMAN